MKLRTRPFVRLNGIYNILTVKTPQRASVLEYISHENNIDLTLRIL